MLLLSAVSSPQLGKITTYPLVRFSESRSELINTLAPAAANPIQNPHISNVVMLPPTSCLCQTQNVLTEFSGEVI
jgi:hypothetical protein